MPKDAKSPEDLLIKKENLEDLSDDAREVIDLVLQMRAELEIVPKKIQGVQSRDKAAVTKDFKEKMA